MMGDLLAAQATDVFRIGLLAALLLTTLRNLSLLDHWADHLTERKHLDHRTRSRVPGAAMECVNQSSQ